MAGKVLKFKKNPKFPHKRSEGLTHRGQKRIENLLRRKQHIAEAVPHEESGKCV